MSNALGIAAVTHVMKDLLNDGMLNAEVNSALETEVRVTSLSPAQVDGEGSSAGTRLNLFLYHLEQNTGWKNHNYPSRNGRGERAKRPPLALDLYYLLTAYGEAELHAEILLGYAMQILHEHPFLDRDLLRTSLNTATIQDPDNQLPPLLEQLGTSGLADQFEQIKISPHTLNTEEVSKLWTAFSTSFRPSAAYMASVVLIESQESVSSPLPVRRRNIYPVPVDQPKILELYSRSQDLASEPILANRQIVMGDRVFLRGTNLFASEVLIRFNEESLVPDQISDREVSFVLAGNTVFQAGMLGLQIQHNQRVKVLPEETTEPPIPESFRTLSGPVSNLYGMVLSPAFTQDSLSITPDGDLRNVELTLLAEPHLHQGQRVELLLNEMNVALGQRPLSYNFRLPDNILADIETPLDRITFNTRGIQSGTYLLRLRVDGADSPLSIGPGGYDNPQIVIA